MRRALLSFASVVFCFGPIACSSTDPPAATGDAGDDVVLEDIPPFEEPVFDSDDPLGRVLVLPLFDPVRRCLIPATEIGHFDQDDAGKIAECAPIEICYVRPDGILAYHNVDCVHGSNFRANWNRTTYSDLGPCEPLKRIQFDMKECPNASCTFARDVVIDTTKSCATAITSKGCRDKLGTPTKCFCNGSGSVFIGANATTPGTPPAGFTACDSAPECTKALAIVDTVKGCAVASTDAGTSDATDGG
jgi:hypothetical protein